jgi:3-methyladenine DNA glycosylase AlkD
MKCEEIVKELKSISDPKCRECMARFSVGDESALGVSISYLMRLAQKICRKDHELAQELWETGIHEARLLACMVDEPENVTRKQMDEWVNDFRSWDLCDQCCSRLFDKTPIAYEKAREWVKDDKEFVRRAGFAMMAALSVHDKNAPDEKFRQFFPLIKEYSTDERNFVKKAVNWTLRAIGKRSLTLNEEAIKVAEEIRKIDSKSARWIASDTLRELKSEKVQKRLLRKKGGERREMN